VGDVDGGGPELALQLADAQAHALAEGGVEVGQRFVEKHDLRAGDHGAGQGDALLLAAGELAVNGLVPASPFLTHIKVPSTAH